LRLFSKYSAVSVISSFSRLAIGGSSLAVLPPILLLFISHWYYAVESDLRRLSQVNTALHNEV